MPIPKIQNVPTKQITLPLSNKKVKIRPFLVKEEKILIMAREAEADSAVEEYINAMKQIVDACSFGQLNADELSQVDLEYIFIQIRMMSKGETSKFKYRCLEQVPDPENEGETKQCGTSIPVTLNLKEITLEKDENHKTLFQIPNNDIYIQMKYPSVSLAAELEKEGISQENVENMKWTQVEYLIVSCIEAVIQGNEESADTYSDFSRKEMIEWLESVPSETLENIVENFFQTVPKLSHTVKAKCPGCGKKHEIYLTGLENFFD